MRLSRAALNEAARLRRDGQQQQHEVGGGQHGVGIGRPVHMLHVGHRGRAEPRADHAHLDGLGLARHLLADHPQAQDAERGAGERLRDAPPPAPLLLVLRDARIGLGEVKERAQDVLRHLHPMGPARAGERQALRQIGQREPALHPGGQRLQPPKPGHLREHARARPEGEHRLAARE
jgi:hypothetical protein